MMIAFQIVVTCEVILRKMSVVRDGGQRTTINKLLKMYQLQNRYPLRFPGVKNVIKSPQLSHLFK